MNCGMQINFTAFLYDVVGGYAIKFNDRILVTATDAARKVVTSVGMQWWWSYNSFIVGTVLVE